MNISSNVICTPNSVNKLNLNLNLNYTILYMYYTILYYTILYYTILYYTILYYLSFIDPERGGFGKILPSAMIFHR